MKINSRFINTSNDFTFTGNVTVSTPSGASNPATKTFIDTNVFGVQGVNGVQGSTGSNGSNGFQGAVGSNGTNGFQGSTGSNGSNGFQGSTGSNGANGFQGTAGSNGANGFQGATGSNGTNGFQGAVGSNGANGFQGAVGSNGTNGFQGAAGSNGSNGFQGITGSNGTSGPQGLTGVQGLIGVQGAAGSAGAQGFLGMQGSLGLQGSLNKYHGSLSDFTYVTSDTTERSILTVLAPNLFLGSPTIPANTLAVGKVLRFSMRAYLNAFSPAPNVTIRIKLGGVTIYSSGPVLFQKDLVDVPFDNTFIFNVRTTGSSGTIANANALIVANDFGSFTYQSSSVATIDTTIDNLIDITMQSSATSASTTLTIRSISFEIL